MSSQAVPAPAQELGFGIACIDTLQVRPGLACCYLVQRGGDYAFIETGTAPGVPRLLSLLDARGIARARVRYVIPTHAHLDHAGGAGLLMHALPGAELIAHPRAARHLIEPARLIAGASAVYGAGACAQMYGGIVPVEAERIRTMADGERLAFGDGELLFLDTPGHARHHFCIWDEASRGFFTGDTFGLSYRDFDGPGRAFMLPTTTPVQFEPEVWLTTLERLLSWQPQRMYLTHYGRVEDVAKLAEDLCGSLRRYKEIGLTLASAPQRRARLREAFAGEAIAALHKLGNRMDETRARELLAADMELNAQGVEVWLDRR